jgi:hypothetical protein
VLLVPPEVPAAALELKLELELEEPPSPAAADETLEVVELLSEQANPSEPKRKRQGPMICEGRVCIVSSPAMWHSEAVAPLGQLDQNWFLA